MALTEALAIGPLVGAPSTVDAAGVSIAAPAQAPRSHSSVPETLLYGLAAFGAIRARKGA